MEYIIGLIVLVALGFHFLSPKIENTTRVAKAKPSVIKPTPAKSKKPSVAELKKLTKVQLLDYADKNNIKVKRSGSKAEVVKAISTSK